VERGNYKKLAEDGIYSLKDSFNLPLALSKGLCCACIPSISLFIPAPAADAADGRVKPNPQATTIARRRRRDKSHV
jgi:hypothetical protein